MARCPLGVTHEVVASALALFFCTGCSQTGDDLGRKFTEALKRQDVKAVEEMIDKSMHEPGALAEELVNEFKRSRHRYIRYDSSFTCKEGLNGEFPGHWNPYQKGRFAKQLEAWQRLAKFEPSDIFTRTQLSERSICLVWHKHGKEWRIIARQVRDNVD